MSDEIKLAIKKFYAMPAAPGIFLVIAASLAMIVQNSPLDWLYAMFKDVPVVLQIGAFKIDKPLLLWINDGIMALFFLLVGLEMKREMMEGHLSTKDQITLPLLAAIGGVAVPAIVFALLNLGSPETMRGWAIPAATDIAFALGILLVLGDRIPPALKVCLVAIAIIDDLAAIIIIAIFYTAETSLVSLGLAGFFLAIAYFLSRQGVARLGAYVVLGLLIWASVLKSGVHATLAGVALGLIIPLRAKNKDGKAPLKVMEHALHPWVAFGVLPLFAFANAGVSLQGLTLDSFLAPLPLGIMLGLFVGKQIGVMGITYVAVKMKLAKLPTGVNWMQFYGMALLTGVGFTMSLFIGTLAFSDVAQAVYVRIGVLSGSLLSAVVGIAVLLASTKAPVAAKDGDRDPKHAGQGVGAE